MATIIETDELIEDDISLEELLNSQLIVWNDDNEFDDVIDAFCEVLKHTPEQAEQCALLIHFNGKYAVKEGTYETLKPYCDALNERKLTATIQ